MRVGARRHLIAIQQKSEVGRTELNEPIYDWVIWREPYCEITTKRGTEHFDAATKQRYPETVYWFRCLLIEVEGLDPSRMRVEYDSKHYDIKNVLPDEQHQDDCIIVATLQGAGD